MRCSIEEPLNNTAAEEYTVQKCTSLLPVSELCPLSASRPGKVQLSSSTTKSNLTLSSSTPSLLGVGTKMDTTARSLRVGLIILRSLEVRH